MRNKKKLPAFPPSTAGPRRDPRGLKHMMHQCLIDEIVVYVPDILMAYAALKKKHSIRRRWIIPISTRERHKASHQ